MSAGRFLSKQDGLPGAVSSLVKKTDVKPHWGWPPAHSPATATAAFGFYFFK